MLVPGIRVGVGPGCGGVCLVFKKCSVTEIGTFAPLVHNKDVGLTVRVGSHREWLFLTSQTLSLVSSW